MTNWIDVKDRLPEKYERVLVYIVGDANPEICVSHYDDLWVRPEEDENGDDTGRIETIPRWDYNGRPMYSTSWYQKVTHWATLPEPPR